MTEIPGPRELLRLIAASLPLAQLSFPPVIRVCRSAPPNSQLTCDLAGLLRAFRGVARVYWGKVRVSMSMVRQVPTMGRCPCPEKYRRWAGRSAGDEEVERVPRIGSSGQKR
jgi:hypothetical protein